MTAPFRIRIYNTRDILLTALHLAHSAGKVHANPLHKDKHPSTGSLEHLGLV